MIAGNMMNITYDFTLFQNNAFLKWYEGECFSTKEILHVKKIS